jgi:hypothetical protein
MTMQRFWFLVSRPSNAHGRHGVNQQRSSPGGMARLPTPPLFPPCYVGPAGAP